MERRLAQVARGQLRAARRALHRVQERPQAGQRRARQQAPRRAQAARLVRVQQQAAARPAQPRARVVHLPQREVLPPAQEDRRQQRADLPARPAARRQVDHPRVVALPPVLVARPQVAEAPPRVAVRPARARRPAAALHRARAQSRVLHRHRAAMAFREEARVLFRECPAAASVAARQFRVEARAASASLAAVRAASPEIRAA